MADTIAFDAAYYLATNPDVAAAVSAGTITALDHWKQFGASEGRNPSPLFNTSYYLAQNSDVKVSGINPLDHFNKFGAVGGRDPAAFFNTTSYLKNNPDVAAAVSAGKTTAFAHFLAFGAKEGRLPSTGFNQQFNAQSYLAANSDVAAAVATGQTTALQHYILFGAKEQRSGAFLSTSDKLNTLSQTIRGRVTDGPVSGASGFVDLNGDGIQEANEPGFTTAKDGSYSINLGSGVAPGAIVNAAKAGQIIVTGGIDQATRKAGGILSAPTGAAQITPLSSVINQMVIAGQSISAATAALSAKLKAPAGVDLLSYDSAAAVSSKDAARTTIGLAIQSLNVKLATLAGSQVKLLITASKGKLSQDAAAGLAFQALNQAINGKSSTQSARAGDLASAQADDTVDLNDPNFIKSAYATLSDVVSSGGDAVEGVDTSAVSSAADSAGTSAATTFATLFDNIDAATESGADADAIAKKMSAYQVVGDNFSDSLADGDAGALSDSDLDALATSAEKSLPTLSIGDIDPTGDGSGDIADPTGGFVDGGSDDGTGSSGGGSDDSGDDDSSGSTPGLSVTLSTSDNATTVSGSSGDDSFTATDSALADITIAGGGGNDTLIASGDVDLSTFSLSAITELKLKDGTATTASVTLASLVSDTTLTDIDATSLSGALTVDGTGYGAGLAIDRGTLTFSDSITGTSQSDILEITADSAYSNGDTGTPLYASVVGIEELRLSNGTATSFSLNISDFTTNTGDTVLGSINAAAITGALTIDGTGYGSTLTIDRGALTADDSIVGTGTDILKFNADSVFPTIALTGIKEIRLSDGTTATTTDLELSTLVSDTVLDTINAASFTGTLTIGGASYAAALNITGGSGADSLVGSGTVASTLTGAGGIDTIVGGTDADTITGGAGADLLTGGGGNNVFVYGDVSAEGGDTINDFVSGTDKLSFSLSDTGLSDSDTDGYVDSNNLTIDLIHQADGTTLLVDGDSVFSYDTATGALTFGTFTADGTDPTTNAGTLASSTSIATLTSDGTTPIASLAITDIKLT